MKKILILALIFGFTCSVMAIIVANPANPVVGDTVKFRETVGAACSHFIWNWGDGSGTGTILVQNDVPHIYKEPGTYTVTCNYSNCMTTPPFVPPLMLTVSDDRFISISPKNPRLGETITITLNNAKSPPVKWILGDGTIKTSTTNQTTHTYTQKGTYLIQAYDFNGTSQTVHTYTVSLEDNRELTVSKLDPKVGEMVTFEGKYFFGTMVRWNFGDGISLMGSPLIQHAFRKPGIFTVRAEDTVGITRAFEVTLNVLPGPSQVSNLMITGIQLFFDRNQSNYLTLPSGAEKVKVKARIKFEGSGSFHAYWTIDQSPFRAVSQILSFGQSTELTLDEVPTLNGGIHEVSIIFMTPKPEFTNIPVIHYFVSGVDKFITLNYPVDGLEFSVHDVPRFSWTNYPLAQNYYFKYANSIELLLDESPPAKTITRSTDWKITEPLNKGTKYFWKVQALDFNRNVIADSEIRSFSLVDNLFKITMETEEELARMGENKHLLLEFSASGNRIINNQNYLIEVQVNDQKTNSFILRGEELGQIKTSVTYQPGTRTTIRLLVHEIQPKGLKLVSYTDRVIE